MADRPRGVPDTPGGQHHHAAAVPAAARADLSDEVEFTAR
jgi:hypothetical protein